VLPSTQRNLGQGGGGGGLELSSDEYLDRIEEELNRRVDHDTTSLVDGMRDLVGLATVSACSSLSSSSSSAKVPGPPSPSLHHHAHGDKVTR